MTHAAYASSRPGVFADAERTVLSHAAALRNALAEYRLHRRTVAELRALSIRQREDLGFAGEDLAEIARAALRRN